VHLKLTACFKANQIYKVMCRTHSIVLVIVLLLSTTVNAQQTVKVDFSKRGKVYEGIGALSAGASTRLLIDYPEPYRSQILDFLFKPGVGASLQHLKVEIGSDVNSTCGTEPSHARTRDEFNHPKPEYFNRGYEWWLMKEAKKRNPNIKLDCLSWGAPGWIGDGKYFSQEHIDYIISFIKAAEQYHGLTIDYTGIWNEREYKIDYIKDLRKALDRNGLASVKLIAADQYIEHQWEIADEILQDEELSQSIDIIGDHYPDMSKKYLSKDTVALLDRPVWNSEGGNWTGDWKGFEHFAKMYNEGYLNGSITKTVSWSLVTSYTTTGEKSFPNSGLMIAKTPWSGYYEVQPGIWTVAHTTQFAKPGWSYIDSGCAYLEKGGSFVTLAAPKDEDLNFSIIIETIDAKETQEAVFNFSNIMNTTVYVRHTMKDGKQFAEEIPLKIKKGKLELTLEPKSLYTFSTLKGNKGKMSPAAEAAFPFPYFVDFEDQKPGSTPKYFLDQGGAFEVAGRDDKKGNCLRQVITQKGIQWNSEHEVLIQTVTGSTEWTNYSVKADVYFREPYSFVSILGRVTEMYRSHKAPDGYILKLESSGKWELTAKDKKLAHGSVKLQDSAWHTLKLKLIENKITAFINDKMVAEIEDSSFNKGLGGLGSSFHQLDFDNFRIE
jgi:galactosylceramidase